MGGHSKKSGKGGGGAHARGDRQQTQRKALKKDLGVPDLKDVKQRLSQTARGRTHSVLSIPHLHGNGADAQGQSSSAGPSSSGLPAGGLRLAGLVRGGMALGKAGSPHVQQKVLQHSLGNDASESTLADRRREMLTLALRTSEKVHDYEAPAQFYNSHNDDGTTAEEDDRWEEDVDRRGQDRSLQRFFKEFRRVVENCDVLLQVLDARDPLGCRLTQLEKNIRSSYGEEKKKIVVVLNKVDMLPSKEVVDAWIHYFEEQEQLMCIPFAATAKGSVGQTYVSNLFRRLRSLARNEETGDRKAIVVGVIGYPNVGKSSIINALKRKQVVGVGNMPGFTTGNTEVELRSDIRVMDCPGVVTPGEDNGDVVLRNAIKVSDLVNPFLPVQRLLQRCTAVQPADDRDNADVAAHQALRASGLHPLALFYGIGQFRENDVMDFIQQVGMRRGRLTRGGQVDEEATARMILTDWNDGRIPYYTYPPAVDELFLRSDDAYRARPMNGSSSGGGGRGAEEDDEGAQAQLMTSMARGVTLDGLPTFHLHMDLIEGRHTKKRWKRGAAAEENDGGSYAYNEDEDADEML